MKIDSLEIEITPKIMFDSSDMLQELYDIAGDAVKINHMIQPNLKSIPDSWFMMRNGILKRLEVFNDKYLNEEGE